MAAESVFSPVGVATPVARDIADQDEAEVLPEWLIRLRSGREVDADSGAEVSHLLKLGLVGCESMVRHRDGNWVALIDSDLANDFSVAVVLHPVRVWTARAAVVGAFVAGCLAGLAGVPAYLISEVGVAPLPALAVGILAAWFAARGACGRLGVVGIGAYLAAAGFLTGFELEVADYVGLAVGVALLAVVGAVSAAPLGLAVGLIARRRVQAEL